MQSESFNFKDRVRGQHDHNNDNHPVNQPDITEDDIHQIILHVVHNGFEQL